MLRIAVINDIHNGQDLGTKKGSAAPKLLAEFVTFVEKKNPKRVLELGDRVNHIDHDTDYKSMKQVSELFSKISIPKVHLMGNHDVDYLTKEENEKLVGCSFDSHTENVDEFTFIYWNADTHLNQKNGFDLKEEDFLWLEEGLKDATYPTVIFSHVPLDNGSMNGNFYFNEKAYPKHGNYPPAQGERAREIIERSGKVVLCVNGHAHWNAYSCIDGIHYVTLPSLTETFVTYPDPHGAWTLIELAKDHVSFEIFGKTPLQFTLPFRTADHHWISMHKDFSPVKIQAK